MAMTTPPFAIRQVGYDDPTTDEMMSALQDYYRSIYNGPDRSPVDPAEFSPPTGRFFVGYQDTVAVAMGGWRWVDPVPGLGATRVAEIKRMYVAEAGRGRGFARSMLAHLETTASGAGADAIVLSTGPAQQAAIALYRSAGYTDIPRFGFYARFEQAMHLGKPLRVVEQAVTEPPAAGTGR